VVVAAAVKQTPEQIAVAEAAAALAAIATPYPVNHQEEAAQLKRL